MAKYGYGLARSATYHALQVTPRDDSSRAVDIVRPIRPPPNP